MQECFLYLSIFTAWCCYFCLGKESQHNLQHWLFESIVVLYSDLQYGLKLPSLTTDFLPFSPVIGVVVGEMVDRSDLVAAALSQDVLTVFQFHSYIFQHEVQDMETHLLHLAREGERICFVLMFTKILDSTDDFMFKSLTCMCVCVVLRCFCRGSVQWGLLSVSRRDGQCACVLPVA